MGSPLGPVLANIFMCHLETKAMKDYVLDRPLFYCRFVDDTFLVFETKSHMLNFFNWMNSQCQCIAFTKEEEQNDQLPFLDVLVTRNSNGKISTTVYRKPSFSGLYLRWDSFVPKQYKRGLINSLVHRVWKICSTYEGFHLELEFIKSVLQANGYPLNFIESCIYRYLSKQCAKKDNHSETVFGPEKKIVVLCLPYIGDQCIKLKRQLERMVNHVTPWISLRIVFRPAYKLSSLSKLKCLLPVMSMSSVVYLIKCKNCEEFYVGKTERRLSQRVKEHMTSSNSALRKHVLSSNHEIDFDSVSILARDQHPTRLLIKETLKIKEHSAVNSLNANMGSFELKLF